MMDAVAPKPLSQKEAVYLITKSVLDEAGISKPEGITLKELITKEIRKQIRVKIYEGLKSGSISLSKKYEEGKLKKYCSLMISNAFENDPRFS
jgi:hypothetical protein